VVWRKTCGVMRFLDRVGVLQAAAATYWQHPLRSFAFFVIAVPSVISLLAILLTAAIRSKRIPVCPRCGRPKVRPSQVTSLIDQTFRMIALAPFRCNGCLARFYAFRGKRKTLVLDRWPTVRAAVENSDRAAAALSRTDRDQKRTRLLGLREGKASFASIFGAAGSIVVLVVWVYYSGQIFFLGAEFTKAFANRYGSQPAETPLVSFR
jgi:hypothetical protein